MQAAEVRKSLDYWPQRGDRTGSGLGFYLAQHGEALSKEVDPERALSERGRKDVERVAGFLKRSIPSAFKNSSTAAGGGTELHQSGQRRAGDPARPRPIFRYGVTSTQRLFESMRLMPAFRMSPIIFCQSSDA